MSCPGAVTLARDGVFVRVSAGVCSTSTVLADGGEVMVVPLGVCALAVAVLVIEPASRSAWVAVCAAVHVTDPAGAMVRCGHTTDSGGPAGAASESLIDSSDMVTLPVFVTRNE